MSLDTLSPSVRNVISSVPVGTATEPIVAGNAVYVFFVRDTRFSGSAERAFKLDHATLRVYGDNQQTARSKAAAITRRVDTCNDLLAEARAFPRGSSSVRPLILTTLPGVCVSLSTCWIPVRPQFCPPATTQCRLL